MIFDIEQSLHIIDMWVDTTYLISDYYIYFYKWVNKYVIENVPKYVDTSSYRTQNYH